ncbi:leucine-rich repeat domain-containing protein [Prevotella copri]|uniref:leucine-rich repeat domain-containing protein n=1 Tax=Segatella copri TaxID=165179 RepID=UPI0022309D4F|nr:leucine-rich repeat domain-containing protein [Segatella copri]MCW4118309.1 leucine-rich repeat domain-containing protein [Segatella copri]
MKKIFQYIMLAVVTIVMASCTSDIEETTATAGKSNVQLVVGEFPAFGDSQTRAIGTPDEGKTSWAEGDELLLEMTSKTFGTKYATFTYNGRSWELTSGELSYKIDEVPTFPHVYYAPNYKWEAGTLVLKEGKVAGTDEYIEGKANITPNGQAITVEFSKATRNYSRLRIATNYSEDITVTVSNFSPGNTVALTDNTYTLTPDNNGNVYLYGHFTVQTSIGIKLKEYSLLNYTFRESTIDGKSYALDANVVFADNMEAEDLGKTIKEQLDAGKTNIKLILASDAGENVFAIIKDALYGGTAGSINLSLIGCKEIPTKGLSNWDGKLDALKSIYLPDITRIGVEGLAYCVYLEEINTPNVTSIHENAFGGCTNLQKITFGELTEVKGLSHDYDGILDPGVDTERINLVLSENQKVMTKNRQGNEYFWTPTKEYYKGSVEYGIPSFLEYKFKSVSLKK